MSKVFLAKQGAFSCERKTCRLLAYVTPFMKFPKSSLLTYFSVIQRCYLLSCKYVLGSLYKIQVTDPVL